MASVKKDPAKRVKKDVYRKTLKAVNVIRQKFDAKPLAKMPNGIPGAEHACPIYYALEPWVRGGVGGRGVNLVVEKEVVCPFDGSAQVVDCEGTSDQLTDDEIFDEFVRQFDGNDEDEGEEAA